MATKRRRRSNATFSEQQQQEQDELQDLLNQYHEGPEDIDYLINEYHEGPCGLTTELGASCWSDDEFLLNAVHAQLQQTTIGKRRNREQYSPAPDCQMYCLSKLMIDPFYELQIGINRVTFDEKTRQELDRTDSTMSVSLRPTEEELDSVFERHKEQRRIEQRAMQMRFQPDMRELSFELPAMWFSPSLTDKVWENLVFTWRRTLNVDNELSTLTLNALSETKVHPNIRVMLEQDEWLASRINQADIVQQNVEYALDLKWTELTDAQILDAIHDFLRWLVRFIPLEQYQSTNTRSSHSMTTRASTNRRAMQTRSSHLEAHFRCEWNNRPAFYQVIQRELNSWLHRLMSQTSSWLFLFPSLYFGFERRKSGIDALDTWIAQQEVDHPEQEMIIFVNLLPVFMDNRTTLNLSTRNDLELSGFDRIMFHSIHRVFAPRL